jgi:hypothetical protein
MKHALIVVAALGVFGLGCGSTPGPDFNQTFPDPYEGSVDFSSLVTAPLPPDAKGASPAVCGTKRCYWAATGAAENQPLTFFAFDAIPSTASPAPVLTAAGVTTTEYDFPQGCVATGTFDPVQSAFRPDQQYSVFDALPVNVAGAPPALPLVQISDVSGLSGWSCQDFKSSNSVLAAEEGANALTPQHVFFRPIVDQTSPIKPSTPAFWAPLSGWWNNLQLAYLDGGEVPTDDQGNLIAMQGALLDTTAGVQSKLTAANVVVLPFRPGEAGWSPLVQLHELAVPSGRTPSSFTAICTTPGNCRPNEVDPSQWTSSPSLTLFVVAGN